MAYEVQVMRHSSSKINLFHSLSSLALSILLSPSFIVTVLSHRALASVHHASLVGALSRLPLPLRLFCPKLRSAIQIPDPLFPLTPFLFVCHSFIAQVHWVRGDASLVGALARVPLRLQLCCTTEIHHLPHRGTASGTSSSQQPTASTSVLGSADVDLSALVAPGPQNKQLPAK